ncbi:hypothetical protein [Parafrigoribacterium soli]|uniref:hypothetical protein n=1 Tax=Parafrigoribacterium soli TaxID=3144663 RepID=UPI0032EDEF2F
MQLGTRWRVGTEAPPRLPDAVLDAVRAVESELRDAVPGSAEWRWTLTWLEGRPVVELDDGTVIRLDPVTGAATVTAWSEESSPDEGGPKSE